MTDGNVKKPQGKIPVTRRRLLQGATALGAASLTAGSLPARAFGQEKPESISLICNNGGWFGYLQQVTVPAWEKKTGIKMETLYLPNEALKARLKAELSSGSAPYDVVIWTGEWRGWIQSFLEDHDKLLSDFDWGDIPDPAKQFGAFKGKQLGIPYRFTVMILHDQKNVLEAAGIDKAPGTFDELQKAAQATTKGDRYGFGIFGKQGAAIVNGWLPFLFAAGGKIYDENTYEIFINQPQAVRALDFYGKLATQWKVIPPELLTWEWDEIIAGGENDRYAMTVMHAPYAASLENPKVSKTVGNWAWSQMPGADLPDEGRSWALGWLLSVPTSSLISSGAWTS